MTTPTVSLRDLLGDAHVHAEDPDDPGEHPACEDCDSADPARLCVDCLYYLAC